MKVRAWVATVALVAALVLAGTPAGATSPGSNGLLAFTRGGDVYTVAPDGTGLRRLTTAGGAAFPRWSPDGTRIAFSRGGYVWTMTATGADKRRLFPGSRASWSPDGRSMAYSDTSAYPAAVMVRPVGGGPATAVEVYADSGACPWERRPGPSARWSADGTSILYGVVEQGGTDDLCGTIGSVTEVREAPPAASPQSPPGRSLTSWPVAARAPEIDTAPTGTRYVFSTDAGSPDGRARLYLGDSATGTRTALGRESGAISPAFSPDGKHVVYAWQAPGGAWLVRQVTLGSPAPPVTLVRHAVQPDWQPRR